MLHWVTSKELIYILIKSSLILPLPQNFIGSVLLLSAPFRILWVTIVLIWLVTFSFLKAMWTERCSLSMVLVFVISLTKEWWQKYHRCCIHQPYPITMITDAFNFLFYWSSRVSFPLLKCQMVIASTTDNFSLLPNANSLDCPNVSILASFGFNYLWLELMAHW